MSRDVPPIPYHDAEDDEVTIEFPDSGVSLKRFSHYRVDSHFLTPADGWSFSIGAEKIDDKTRAAMVPGSKMVLRVNGRIQCSGYVDDLDISASRDSGIEYRIDGRDMLAQVVDSGADPTLEFKTSQTLADILEAIFTPFGFTDFEIDNEANLNVITGQKRGVKVSKKKQRPLKKITTHQVRPYNHEGAFAFAARIAQRHGLWIWPAADGKTLIVSTPDFDQDATYTLARTRTGNSTNILHGGAHWSNQDQPTMIVADGFSGGGEFGKGKIKVIAENPAVTTADPAQQVPFQRYPGAQVEVLDKLASQLRCPRARIVYLHDDESRTLDELAYFVRREIAHATKKSFVARYTVQGHGMTLGDDYRPWAVDTVVNVFDEAAGIAENLYVLGRTFTKSRSGGTMTELELVKLHSLEF